MAADLFVPTGCVLYKILLLSGGGGGSLLDMVIGLLRVRLHLPFTHSLKEKRSVLKRLIHRLRTNYNCAVGETEFQDHWQTAELSIVTVYAQKEMVESLLKSVEKELGGNDDFELSMQEIEFL